MINKIRNLHTKNEEGFTLMELMIVVVIIGILAAIALPIFTTQVKAANDAKSKAAIRELRTAIEVARVKTGLPLMAITGSTCTFCGFGEGSADPLTLPETEYGWRLYNRTLDRISVASGMDVRGLLDAYGRPIFIDENETEPAKPCSPDILASYKPDYPSYSQRDNTITLPLITTACTAGS